MRPALSDYQYLASGKVRELYRIDDGHLLFVATDRISAFDYILDSQIPDKGRILTAMSVFFFDYVTAPNHLAGPPDDERIPEEVLGRALVVQQLEMVPVEGVARGYLTGSGLIDYQSPARSAASRCRPGLVEASKFAQPMFTPATKAVLGEHDENIDFDDVIERSVPCWPIKLREGTLRLYIRAASYARTGASSWPTPSSSSASTPMATWSSPTRCSPRTRPATGPPRATSRAGAAELRQAVRPQLAHRPGVRLGPGERHPPPPLPQDIVDATRARYIEAYERISGLSFDDWIGADA